MKVVMDYGTEAETGPRDTAVVPPGYNAWVVKNEPCIAIDSTGAKITLRNNSISSDSNVAPNFLNI